MRGHVRAPMKMKASELESSGMMSCQRATARAGEVRALEGVIDHRAEKNGVPRGPTWKLAWKRKPGPGACTFTSAPGNNYYLLSLSLCIDLAVMACELALM